MANILIIIMILGIFIPLIPPICELFKDTRKLFSKKSALNIFDHDYIDSRSFYLYTFNEVPCTSYIDQIDTTKVFELINSCHGDKIDDVYQSNIYSYEKGKQQFERTLFVLSNKVLVEIGIQFVEIHHSNDNFDFAAGLIEKIKEFKRTADEKFEIHIITLVNNELELKPLDIKPVDLDLALYYNNDFLDLDKIIKTRLGQQNDKGIVLLHGMPGTGKTTYLRHLVGALNKKVLFVSPSVAHNLMNPEFIDLLIDNPNSVLIIEDAENVMVDRKFDRNSTVSNLLNITDGLMSDCLNVQIICTFNSALTMIDSALLRKGRLIARYEFGKLTVQKARQLSVHLGFGDTINVPMTLAEVTHQHELKNECVETTVVGFRRSEPLMN